MTYYLSSFGGAGWQFFDNSGVILSGGKIYSYEAGTTIPAPTYTDSTGGTPHTNPIVLNSAGRVATGEIWLPAGASRKFILTTASDIQLGSFDNVQALASGEATIQNFTGTGAQISFTLSNIPASENATNVYINGVYQQKNTYSVSGNTLLFSEAPPLTASIEVAFF